MEVWRRTIIIENPGKAFWQQELTGGVVVNATGDPDAAFFVGVANTGLTNYHIGIDKDSPQGATFGSLDAGLTSFPVADMPIINGNAMIRESRLLRGPFR